jgi:hypothetical protein
MHACIDKGTCGGQQRSKKEDTVSISYYDALNE